MKTTRYQTIRGRLVCLGMILAATSLAIYWGVNGSLPSVREIGLFGYAYQVPASLTAFPSYSILVSLTLIILAGIWTWLVTSLHAKYWEFDRNKLSLCGLSLTDFSNAKQSRKDRFSLLSIAGNSMIIGLSVAIFSMLTIKDFIVIPGALIGTVISVSLFMGVIFSLSGKENDSIDKIFVLIIGLSLAGILIFLSYWVIIGVIEIDPVTIIFPIIMLGMGILFTAGIGVSFGTCLSTGMIASMGAAIGAAIQHGLGYGLGVGMSATLGTFLIIGTLHALKCIITSRQCIQCWNHYWSWFIAINGKNPVGC